MKKKDSLIYKNILPGLVILAISCLLFYCCIIAILSIDYCNVVSKLNGRGMTSINTRDGVKHLSVIKITGQEYILEVGNKTANIISAGKTGLIRSKTGIKYNNIISSCSADLDNDGSHELLLLVSDEEGGYGQELVIIKLKVSEKNNSDKSRITAASAQSIDLSDLKPWMVETGDVEGDGLTDISIGVYKTAKFHPVEAKRPFVYNWHKDGISPKWRGSRLSRPFERYIFADVDGDKKDEIVAIEYLENGKKVINAYRWKGFGFEAIGESSAFGDIDQIQKSQSAVDGSMDIIARIKEENKWKWAKFRYDNDMFEVKIYGKNPWLMN